MTNVKSVGAVLVAALLLTGARIEAAPILLNGLLTNPSFEGGVQPDGCPVGWTCTNLNVGVGTPTAAQYPTPNGLPSPRVAPDGLNAAFSPVTGSLTGNLRQTISGLQYLAGNSYILDFWLGNPLGGLFPSRIDVQLTTTNASGIVTNNLCDTSGRNSTLVTGALSGNDNGVQCQFSLTGTTWTPGDGDWRLYTLTFTTNVNVPGDVGVQFNVFPQQAAQNGTLMHLDIPQPQTQSVPEPAALALFGAGVVGLGARVRKQYAGRSARITDR